MNLYDLHVTPENLHGYSTREYRIPDYACTIALRNPSLRKVLEPAIAKSAHASYEYALYMNERFKMGEPALLTDLYYARKYMNRLNFGRWPEFENKTKDDPFYSALYARDVLKKEWPEREELIASDAQAAFYYAKDVIKARWPKGEAAIAKNAVYYEAYEQFLKGTR